MPNEHSENNKSHTSRWTVLAHGLLIGAILFSLYSRPGRAGENIAKAYFFKNTATAKSLDGYIVSLPKKDEVLLANRMKRIESTIIGSELISLTRDRNLRIHIAKNATEYKAMATKAHSESTNGVFMHGHAGDRKILIIILKRDDFMRAGSESVLTHELTHAAHYFHDGNPRAVYKKALGKKAESLSESQFNAGVTMMKETGAERIAMYVRIELSEQAGTGLTGAACADNAHNAQKAFDKHGRNLHNTMLTIRAYNPTGEALPYAKSPTTERLVKKLILTPCK